MRGLSNGTSQSTNYAIVVFWISMPKCKVELLPAVFFASLSIRVVESLQESSSFNSLIGIVLPPCLKSIDLLVLFAFS